MILFYLKMIASGKVSFFIRSLMKQIASDGSPTLTREANLSDSLRLWLSHYATKKMAVKVVGFAMKLL